MNKTEYTKHNRDKNLILFQPPEHINKPSHLVKKLFSNSLTTNQKKMYNFLLRELLKNDKTSLETNKILVKRKDIESFLNIKQYKELDADLDKIMGTKIYIEEEKYKTKAVLISSYTMPKDLFDNEADGQNIVIRFDTKLTKTLHNIEKYIKIDLNELQALKNTHAITLYEIFKRQLNNHNTASKINLTIDELKIYLNIDLKQYTRPVDFEKYVVKKAIKEINLNTNLQIDYTRKKIRVGEYIYKFIFNQYIELSFNAFVKILRQKGYYKSVAFTLEGKNYTWQGIDTKTGEYALDITDPKAKILLINEDISRDKILGKKRNYFDNKETLTREEAEEIYTKLYNSFLNDKPFIFIYKLFILNDFDASQNIKSISEIEETAWDFVEEYTQYFTK